MSFIIVLVYYLFQLKIICPGFVLFVYTCICLYVVAYPIIKSGGLKVALNIKTQTQERKVVIQLTGPISGPGFLTLYFTVFLCLMIWGEEANVHLVDVDGFFYHHCLNFLFVLVEKKDVSDIKENFKEIFFKNYTRY